MSDYNDRPTSVTVTPGSGGGLYFIVGALLVLVLVGSYVIMGAPGLNTQVANGPHPSEKIDVTVQQPAAPAMPAPAPERRPDARPERR
jgi:hypothetical protein